MTHILRFLRSLEPKYFICIIRLLYYLIRRKGYDCLPQPRPRPAA